MLRISLVIHLYPLYPVECVVIVHPDQLALRLEEMWQLGRDASHSPAGLEYSRGVRLEMGWDPEGQSRGMI